MRHRPSRRAPQRSQPHPPGACCVTLHRPEIVWWHARTSYTLDDADGIASPNTGSMARFRGTRSVSQRHHPLLGAGCHNVGVAAEADWTGDTTTTQASAEGKLDRWFYCPALRKQRNRALFSVNDGRGILCSEPPGRERLAVEGPPSGRRRRRRLRPLRPRGSQKDEQTKRGGRGRGAVRNGILHLA